MASCAGVSRLGVERVHDEAVGDGRDAGAAELAVGADEAGVARLRRAELLHRAARRHVARVRDALAEPVEEVGERLAGQTVDGAAVDVDSGGAGRGGIFHEGPK